VKAREAAAQFCWRIFLPDLHLSLLGGFLLTATAGSAIALPRKCRALLAYLALTAGHAHSRERLATLLWEESSEAQARTSLRQALTSIRKALPAPEGDLLQADAELIALGMQRLALDAAQFEQLVEQGSAEALEQAAALYRGDLLEGFSSGAPAFEDWARAERERLRGRAREALGRLADHHAGQDRLDQAVAAATRLIALDPLQEHAHRLAMRLYVRQGKAGEALRQYRRCRELLAAELGVPPDAQTEALYRQLLQERRLRPGAGAEQAPEEAANVASGASPDVPKMPAPSAAPQLRDATVMLADLYGFTAFTGQTDPEEVHDYLSRYRAMVNGILMRHGGTLTNYIGARVMAVFGAPVAYGNDSERALRAVLAIRAGARGMTSTGGQRLVPQIGIASGPLLVSADAAGLTVSGEPVSVAARIMETSGPGEIRISDRVRTVLADRIDGEPLPGVAIAAAKPIEI
jgi:DNA-binding SARP family transcriptional activator